MVLKSSSVTTPAEKRMCSGMSILAGQLISFGGDREAIYASKSDFTGLG